MRNYLLKMAHSLYITEIYKFWQRNIIKLNMDFRQNFLLRILLVKQSHDNLRRCNDFRIPSIRSVYHGSESISFQDLKYGIIFPAKLNVKLLYTSSKNKLKNGSHEIAHANCTKFILMMSVSFLSCHKCREILLCVSYLLFFHSKDIDLFIFSTLVSRNDVVVFTLNRKIPAGYSNNF